MDKLNVSKRTQAVEKISKTQEVSVDVLEEEIAFRWERKNYNGSLIAIRKSQIISFNNLCNIDNQLNKAKLKNFDFRFVDKGSNMSKHIISSTSVSE